MAWKKPNISTSDLLTGIGVCVALFIGSMQIVISIQQKSISDQQKEISKNHGEIQLITNWLPYLKDQDPNVRLIAIRALGNLENEAAIGPIAITLGDKNRRVSEASARILSDMGNEKSISILIDVLDNSNEYTKNIAINALIRMGHPKLDLIEKAFVNANPTVRGYGKTIIDNIKRNRNTLEQIGVNKAQNITRGDSSILINLVAGKVDTNDPQLENSLVGEISFVDNVSTPNELTTTMAKLIAANSNGSIIGIAPFTKIYVTQVFDENGFTTTESLVKGIMHSIDIGADIILTPLASSESSKELQQAVKLAFDSGCLIIGVAGNQGNKSKVYPGAYDQVLSVASVNQEGELSEFSSFGEWVDIAAPESGLDEGGLIGTSLSTALVAGSAALVWSADLSLTNKEIKEALKITSSKIDGMNFGILDTYAAILSIQ